MSGIQRKLYMLGHSMTELLTKYELDMTNIHGDNLLGNGDDTDEEKTF